MSSTVILSVVVTANILTDLRRRRWGSDLVALLTVLAPRPAPHAAGRESKPLNYDELERWTRVDHERGMRTRNGER
jgi:hypothetical protein